MVAARCRFANAKFMLPPAVLPAFATAVTLALFPNSLASNSQNAETGIPMRQRRETLKERNWRERRTKEENKENILYPSLVVQTNFPVRFRNHGFRSIGDDIWRLCLFASFQNASASVSVVFGWSVGGSRFLFSFNSVLNALTLKLLTLTCI